MREAAFVRQNKDNWLKFESALKNKTTISANELSSLYLKITDDLGYARTFYPKSDTLSYLNELASLAHQKIYKTKKESKARFISFFTEEFPTEFYQYQKQLLLAFLVFVLFGAIGFFSPLKDATFVRFVLGDAYVNQTLENIAQNDPMAVYKKMNQLDMFMGITVNNIRVALMAFVFGIFMGLGTIFVLMKNAIMIGAFHYLFYEQNLLWEASKTIWIHGTIEISVIIVASCAGLVVGKSILFPKTYTRLASFVKGVKAGLKIVISTIPFFIIAGFLEGFVTRYTQMPNWLAILVIGTSLLLILFYYVYYPVLLNKKHDNQPHKV